RRHCGRRHPLHLALPGRRGLPGLGTLRPGARMAPHTRRLTRRGHPRPNRDPPPPLTEVPATVAAPCFGYILQGHRRDSVFRIARKLTTGDLDKALRQHVTEGLTCRPKQLPPKWFYDTHGSALFEDITQLPEYYPTRAERTILERHADEIAEVADAKTLVELGSGSGIKTRLLLAAMRRHGRLSRFVPVDVSGDFLAASAARLAEDRPDVEVHAVVCDFEKHLDLLPLGAI